MRRRKRRHPRSISDATIVSASIDSYVASLSSSSSSYLAATSFLQSIHLGICLRPICLYCRRLWRWWWRWSSSTPYAGCHYILWRWRATQTRQSGYTDTYKSSGLRRTGSRWATAATIRLSTSGWVPTSALRFSGWAVQHDVADGTTELWRLRACRQLLCTSMSSGVCLVELFDSLSQTIMNWRRLRGRRRLDSVDCHNLAYSRPRPTHFHFGLRNCADSCCWLGLLVVLRCCVSRYLPYNYLVKILYKSALLSTIHMLWHAVSRGVGHVSICTGAYVYIRIKQLTNRNMTKHQKKAVSDSS